MSEFYAPFTKIDGDYFIENWEGGLRIDLKKISK
jgi:hypothetical protein